MIYVIPLIVGVFILSISTIALLKLQRDNARYDYDAARQYIVARDIEIDELKRQVYDEGEDPDDHYKELNN